MARSRLSEASIQVLPSKPALTKTLSGSAALAGATAVAPRATAASPTFQLSLPILATMDIPLGLIWAQRIVREVSHADSIPTEARLCGCLGQLDKRL